jgi:hypothetical protein
LRCVSCFQVFADQRCNPRNRSPLITMTTNLRPIDYTFAAAFGITLGLLLAAFI